MKNKIKKAICLVAVIVIVLASFILPSSAASSSVSLLYISLVRDRFNGTFRYDCFDESLVAFDQENLCFNINFDTKYNEDWRYFGFYNHPMYTFTWNWYAVLYEFECNSMVDGVIDCEYLGKKAPLLYICDNTIRLFASDGEILYTLSPSGDNDARCQIVCMINVYEDLLFVSVDDSFNDEVSFVGNGYYFGDYVTYDGLSEGSFMFRFCAFSTQTYQNLTLTIRNLDIFDVPYVNDAGTNADWYYPGYEVAESYNNYRLYIDYFYNLGFSNALNSSDSQIYQEAYNEGYRNGESDGITEGYSNGESQGYTNGYTDGYTEGKADGITEGYSNGESQGYTNGYTEGKADGIGEGYLSGKEMGYGKGWEEGWQQGKTDGIDVGYNQGLGEGYSEGLVHGYEDGYIEGSFKGKKVGYQNGLQDGAKNVYNELYDKGLDAIDENEGTLMQGFLSGMWNGVQNFVQELLDGITFSDLSLRKIVTTLLAIVLAAFVIRMVRG